MKNTTGSAVQFSHPSSVQIIPPKASQSHPVKTNGTYSIHHINKLMLYSTCNDDVQ